MIEIESCPEIKGGPYSGKCFQCTYKVSYSKRKNVRKKHKNPRKPKSTKNEPLDFDLIKKLQPNQTESTKTKTNGKIKVNTLSRQSQICGVLYETNPKVHDEVFDAVEKYYINCGIGYYYF